MKTSTLAFWLASTLAPGLAAAGRPGIAGADRPDLPKVERDPHHTPEGDAPPIAYQLSTGTGIGTYVLYAARVATSEKLGYLVVTSKSPPAGYLANYEHFLWLDAAKAWPDNFYVHAEAIAMATLPGLIQSAGQVDKFNNNVGCKTTTPGIPKASVRRWQAQVIPTTGAAVSIPAVLFKSTSLLGRWTRSKTCQAIAPGTDGWIDLVIPTVSVSNPASWGTPPASSSGASPTEL